MLQHRFYRPRFLSFPIRLSRGLRAAQNSPLGQKCNGASETKKNVVRVLQPFHRTLPYPIPEGGTRQKVNEARAHCKTPPALQLPSHLSKVPRLFNCCCCYSVAISSVLLISQESVTCNFVRSSPATATASLDSLLLLLYVVVYVTRQS